MSLVIDASVVAAWVFADERSTASASILRSVGAHGAVAPAIWPLEGENLLLTGERQGRMTRGERDAFLVRLAELPVRIEMPAWVGVNEALALADTHRLTAYDAAYLELAHRLHLPLASKDDLLVLAAAGLGVEVLTA